MTTGARYYSCAHCCIDGYSKCRKVGPVRAICDIKGRRVDARDCVNCKSFKHGSPWRRMLEEGQQ